MASILYTTVQNLLAKATVFSFIPPHGKVLAANETYTVAGNIIDRLAVKTSNRQFLALERALTGAPGTPHNPTGHPPSLTIVSTPSMFVFDDEEGPKVVGVEDGALGMVDPSWTD